MKPWFKTLLRLLGGLLAAIALLLVVVKLVYGGGEPYPGVETEPVVPAEQVEVVFEHDWPLGNVATTEDGRVFFNTHPFVQVGRFEDAFFFELVEGKAVPWPSEELQPDLEFAFGMTIDGEGRLWTTSPATLDRDQTRLQAFDLKTGERVEDQLLAEGVARFGQDLRVTPDGTALILADTGAFRFTPGHLVIVDLKSWKTREVLKDSASTQPQDWAIETDQGIHAVGWGLVTFSVGVDGIAFDRSGEHLYFAAMSHDTLYRVPTDELLDPAGDPSSHIQAVGKKPLSDGIAVGPKGTVLITDVEHGSVAGLDPETGEVRTLVKLDSVLWSDGISVAKKRAYFTDSAIPRYLDPLLRPPERATLEAGRPYRLHAFTLP